MAKAVRARQTALKKRVAAHTRGGRFPSAGVDPFDGRKKIRIGVSSCLLGEKVRFDGRDKFDSYLVRTMGRYFDFVPVCPEVGIGLGVPRMPIQLVGTSKPPRAVGVYDPTLDVTDRLSVYARRMARKLAKNISGYVFKSGSPSCGLQGVAIHNTGGAQNGRGVYAAAFLATCSLVPAEEEGALGDPELRANFINRVIAYHRWQRLVTTRLTAAKLVGFHSAHKLSLMAHSQSQYRALGRLVAQAGRSELTVLREKYIRGFMHALQQHATRAGHSNVLMHLMGYLKNDLDVSAKQELLALIHNYRQGRIPRMLPLGVLRHYFKCHPHPYVDAQVYMEALPAELMSR